MEDVVLLWWTVAAGVYDYVGNSPINIFAISNLPPAKSQDANEVVVISLDTIYSMDKP